MIKASELKENDVVTIDDLKYRVISNHIGDVIFIANEEMHELKGLHIFYDDPADAVEDYIKTCIILNPKQLKDPYNGGYALYGVEWRHLT